MSFSLRGTLLLLLLLPRAAHHWAPIEHWKETADGVFTAWFIRFSCITPREQPCLCCRFTYNRDKPRHVNAFVVSLVFTLPPLFYYMSLSHAASPPFDVFCVSSLCTYTPQAYIHPTHTHTHTSHRPLEPRCSSAASRCLLLKGPSSRLDSRRSLRRLFSAVTADDPPDLFGGVLMRLDMQRGPCRSHNTCSSPHSSWLSGARPAR